MDRGRAAKETGSRLDAARTLPAAYSGSTAGSQAATSGRSPTLSCRPALRYLATYQIRILLLSVSDRYRDRIKG